MSAQIHKMHNSTRHSGSGAQSGQAIVLIALAMVALLGMAGLALDGGSLMFAERKAQTIAEMLAMSVAANNCATAPSATPQIISHVLGANEITLTDPNVTVKLNGSAVAGSGSGDSATILINNPPQSGPNAGNSNAFEVIVRLRKASYFIHVVYKDDLFASGRSVTVCSNSASVDGRYILYATSKVCPQHSLHVSNGGAYFDGSFWSNTGVSVTGATTITGTVSYRVLAGESDDPYNSQLGVGNINAIDGVNNTAGILGVPNVSVAGNPPPPDPNNMSGWLPYEDLSKSPPLPDLNIADFRPGGAAALAAGSNYHILKPSGSYLYTGPGIDTSRGSHWYNFSRDSWNAANFLPLEGLIYVPGDFGASGGNYTNADDIFDANNVNDGLTIVVEGLINMSGVSMSVDHPFTNNLAMWANKWADEAHTTAHCGQDAVSLGSVGTTWRGLLYAPGGQVNIPMSHAESMYGAIIANTINISTGSTKMYYEGSAVHEGVPAVYYVE